MLGFAMQGDSSLMLRMTLTQYFKKLNCHSEAKLKNLKPQHLEKNQKLFCREEIYLFRCLAYKCVSHTMNVGYSIYNAPKINNAKKQATDLFP